jgi:DnaJ-class molecular chaperone
MATYYEILSVAQNAPDSVIKAAYKALCQTDKSTII